MTISIITLWLFVILFYTVIGTWKLFEKAGRKQWEAFIPLYNIFVWLKITKKPLWWFVLLFIPCLGQLIIIALLNVSIGRTFNKTSFIDVLLQLFIPFIYFPLISYNPKLAYNEGIKRKIRAVEVAFLFIVFISVFRTYFFEFFTIPTPAMKNEILVGDYVIANKMKYGIKIPATPYSIPFFHNNIPVLNLPSYFNLTLKEGLNSGGNNVKRNDIIVFNYPMGDTSIIGRYPNSVGAGGNLRGHNYYEFIRNEAFRIAQTQFISEEEFFKRKVFFEAKARENIIVNNKLYDFKIEGFVEPPVDKREYYIFRAVAIPGDELQIKNGNLLINSKINVVSENVKFNYRVSFNRALSVKEFEVFSNKYGFDLNIYKDIIDIYNRAALPSTGECIISMTDNIKTKITNDIKAGEYGNLEILNATKMIDSSYSKLISYMYFYPNNENILWNVDNYGPIWVPKKGETIKLTEDNWMKYKRCISAYENNSEVKKSKEGIFINGKKVNDYTFKQNYFFVLGDNRHNSADSRMWGFVPQNYIVGKAIKL